MKINRFTHYFALIFLLFFNSFYAQQESNPTNIIFYLSDDQDLLDYGVYGNPKVETSNVDRLATQGIKFTNFYTGQGHTDFHVRDKQDALAMCALQIASITHPPIGRF